MNEHRMSTVFLHGFERYLDRYGPQPPEQYRVAHCITGCRTSVLGGHVHACDRCGERVPVYNSCLNRHCPHCQNMARQRWIDARMAELLPVPYFHAVFTIPHELNPFVLRNKKAMYAILFRSVKETLLTLADNSKWLGASIGLIAVLHTWGQNLMEHPHIHCIIPAGGLSRDGMRWIPCKGQFLFPFPVMKKLFAGKVLDYFRQAVREGEILMHGTLGEYEDRAVFDNFVRELYRKKWVVFVKQPFAGPASVVKYLGNYTHRTAISERRITGVSAESVSFCYKDYRDNAKQKEMTLDPVEFIRRFMLHVLPKGFMRIRHYGLLSSRGREKKLPLCAVIFSSMRERRKIKVGPKPWYERYRELYGRDPRICKNCGQGIMMKVAKIEPLSGTAGRGTT